MKIYITPAALGLFLNLFLILELHKCLLIVIVCNLCFKDVTFLYMLHTSY